MSHIIHKILKDPLEVIKKLSIEELEEVITYAADKYYNSGESVINDQNYDLLIDFLKARAPKSQVLKNVGAKVKSKNKVILDYWLGSMDKIKPSDNNEFTKWITQFKKPYYLSDKLDGISALITYRKDGQINLYNFNK